MEWRGKQLETMGDMISMVQVILKEGTKEEARDFMRAYSLETVHAYSNIGYMAGYLGAEEMRQVFDWFEVAHPVFGTSSPSPEEAFAMGQRMGKQWKENEQK